MPHLEIPDTHPATHGPVDLDPLFEQVYAELHDLAEAFLRHERIDHTLQPTALVNELYLRLNGKRAIVWRGRKQFLALATQTIRRILIEHARRRLTVKRGGGRRCDRYDLADCGFGRDDAALLDLDAALHRLADLNDRQARVVELRYFGGLGVEQTAAVIGVSPRTVKEDWRVARAWLLGQLEA